MFFIIEGLFKKSIGIWLNQMVANMYSSFMCTVGSNVKCNYSYIVAIRTKIHKTYKFLLIKSIFEMVMLYMLHFPFHHSGNDWDLLFIDF